MRSGQVAVTGANSAVGKALLARLAGEDTLRVTAGVRRPRALAGLPQSPRIAPRLIDYDSSDSLRALLDGADCVVHLAGVLFESPSSRYAVRERRYHAGNRWWTSARDAGVGRIVFVSSLGANPRSSNGYFRSKGEAEARGGPRGRRRQRSSAPRCCWVPGTAGGRALLRDASRGSVRVLGGGVHLLRPLDVDDLCSAILHCCAQPAGGARTYQLVAVAEGYGLTDLPVGGDLHASRSARPRSASATCCNALRGSGQRSHGANNADRAGEAGRALRRPVANGRPDAGGHRRHNLGRDGAAERRRGSGRRVDATD